MADYVPVNEYVSTRSNELSLELDMLRGRGPDGPTEFRAQRDAIDRFLSDVASAADGLTLSDESEELIAAARSHRENINARMARWGMV